MGVMFMIYTVGFFIAYESGEESSVVQGDYRFFEGEDWAYPAIMRLSGFDDNFTTQVAAQMEPDIDLEIVDSENNSTFFQENCTGDIAWSAYEEVCVFLDTNSSYSIFYGGKEWASPTSPSLAAAQYAVDQAMLQVLGANETELLQVSKIQRVPELVKDEDIEPDPASLLVLGIMHVLSSLIMVMFLIGPITFEKINDVTRSFLLAGVKMRSYLLQWLLYYALNGILTAGSLTLISIYYRMMPMSNGGLIFISHYLGLLQTYSAFILLMQFIEQEELAQTLPWIMGMLSMVIGAVVLVLQEATSLVLTVLAVFSPFIGILQYYGIYITYDSTGYDTGIHPGDNVADSGLLANMIAQLVGIAFWVGGILLYSSPKFHALISKGSKQEKIEDQEDSQKGIDAENFESLPRDAEVLLSLRGVEHTYKPHWFKCDKNAKPVEVLKGLDMDICRGEVFGYLGHNGSGKSTSINILSTELELQSGNVCYHLRKGTADLSNPEDAAVIRTKIGVCPQHNTTLQDNLTCRETLRLFAHLKGGIAMSEGQSIDDAVEAEVERRLEDVSFTSKEDADKEVGSYSGGMKRKVLIAMALLGDPEVVFLACKYLSFFLSF